MTRRPDELEALLAEARAMLIDAGVKPSTIRARLSRAAARARRACAHHVHAGDALEVPRSAAPAAAPSAAPESATAAPAQANPPAGAALSAAPGAAPAAQLEPAPCSSVSRGTDARARAKASQSQETKREQQQARPDRFALVRGDYWPLRVAWVQRVHELTGQQVAWNRSDGTHALELLRRWGLPDTLARVELALLRWRQLPARHDWRKRRVGLWLVEQLAAEAHAGGAPVTVEQRDRIPAELLAEDEQRQRARERAQREAAATHQRCEELARARSTPMPSTVRDALAALGLGGVAA